MQMKEIEFPNVLQEYKETSSIVNCIRCGWMPVKCRS